MQITYCTEDRMVIIYNPGQVSIIEAISQGFLLSYSTHKIKVAYSLSKKIWGDFAVQKSHTIFGSINMLQKLMSH